MKSKTMISIFVIILVLLISAGGLLIDSFTKKQVIDELQMAMLVVIAIAALMTVLFIMAAGFRAMRLTDRKQALGLPEGSIRAMIALVLIMVFIIFGIYLFRMVGYGGFRYLGHMQTLPESGMIGGRQIIYEKAQESWLKDKGWYDVYVSTEANDDAKKLAQQLITTVATLVVSIASFYFGSSIASSAVKKEITSDQATSVESNLVFKEIMPNEGAKGNVIPLEIEGKGFTTPIAVRLLRGNDVIEGTDVFSNPTKIQCKIKLDKDPGGKWDVVIENGDGNKMHLAEVFNITQS